MLQPPISISNAGISYLITVLAKHRRPDEAFAVSLGRSVMLVISIRLSLIRRAGIVIAGEVTPAGVICAGFTVASMTFALGYLARSRLRS